MYALFQDGKMISKPLPSQDACAAVAAERDLFVPMTARIVPMMLAPGVNIRNLDPPSR